MSGSQQVADFSSGQEVLRLPLADLQGHKPPLAAHPEEADASEAQLFQHASGEHQFQSFHHPPKSDALWFNPSTGPQPYCSEPFSAPLPDGLAHHISQPMSQPLTSSAFPAELVDADSFEPAHLFADWET